MSGYQVQTPNFFVSLNQGDVAESQIALLQDTYRSPSAIYTGTKAATLLQVYYTGNANNLPGAFFYLTGGSAVTITLPTSAEAFADMSQEILEVLGNQILAVPATQRAAVASPALGSNFQFTIFNGSAGTITLAAPAGASIGSTTQIEATKAGVVTATLVDKDLPKIAYTLNA